MASVPETPPLLPADLHRKLGELRPEDEAWLATLFQCFPIPRADCAPDVTKALGRLLGTAPWVEELFGGSDFTVRLRRLGMLLDEHIGPRELTAKRLRTDFGGPFLLTGTLMPVPGLALTPGVEALRAIWAGCRWRWLEEGDPRITAINELAEAIRAIKDGGGVSQRVLAKVGSATSCQSFADLAEGIKRGHGEGLVEAWIRHYEPTLRGGRRSATGPSAVPAPPGRPTAAPGPPPTPAPTGPANPAPPSGSPAEPTAPRPPRSGGKSSGATDEDELVDKLQRSIRRGQGPRPENAAEPIPGEPMEELTPSVLTSPLPEAPAHEDASDLLRYQVRQAIWNTNYLLLPNHPDVLPLPDYIRVVSRILAQLEDETQDAAPRCGTAGLLVQALTGRTPRSFKALSILANAKTAHDADRMDLLLKEGAFRLSCFWQVPGPGYEPSQFRPSGDQAKYLEETREEFWLLLAPAFRDALVENADALRELVALPVGEIESRLRQAARGISEGEGVAFTIGQLRSSFSAHLFELCRDTATTELICADTLGQSIAPLAYYAPRARSLAQSHWSFQQVLLGTAESLPAFPLSDERVGSRLLVGKRHAQAMARSASRTFHHGVTRLLEEGRLVEVHHAMVGHLAGMLMAVATHRPTEALLKLTVSDFLIGEDAGAALFRDKVHDAAHDPRLVALPATVSRQLKAYLDHLGGLAEHLAGAGTKAKAEAKVSKILKGKAPLLVGLSDDGQLLPLDLTALKSLMRPEWQVLPMNWGRHWMRTHAVEQGVSPELVSIQMGHLEAVGYPFSGASPTVPRQYVEVIAPGWDELARAQGWQVVQGLPTTRPVEPRMLTPLREWNQAIKKHEAAQRAEAKLWRTAMKAKLREYRDDAKQAVLTHPELVSAGIVSRFEDRRSGLERHGLTRADFERIRDDVYERAGDDLALAIARANAVCDVARVVNHRTRQISETPGKVFNLRRPLDNAYIPGMMEAVRQIQALREHLATLSTQKPQDRWQDMASACACAALAMVLFGYCESPEQIQGAIERRNQLQRSATLEDAVLVPWGDRPHQVLGLRSIAATVLARLSWKRGKDKMPPWNDVEARLADFLPAWALAGKQRSKEGVSVGLLDRLCQTAAVAHRYELSPGARRANALSGGSTPAHIREQLALLDGDPAGTVIRDWEEEGPGASEQQDAVDTRKRLGNARTQYNALCALFPSTTKDTALPETGHTIASGEAAASRNWDIVASEIKAQLCIDQPERRLQPIVRMLASWIVDLMVHGTPKKDAPAFSTVKDYLTRIGGPLVEIFGQSAMTDVDEAELEDAYLATIETKKARDTDLRQRTAAALLLFHAHCQEHFGLPDIDLSGVKLHLGDDPEALSDARLVLPAERAAIMARLEDETRAAETGRTAHEVRTMRQALQVMPLFGLGGLRRGEGLGLQFRDVAESGGRLRIRIRPNNSRRLKTVRGRRIIELPAEATVVGGLNLAKWVETERARLRKTSLETAYVFTPVDDPSDAKARIDVAQACLKAVRHVTGRRHGRLHALRHLVAMEVITPVFLTAADREALADSLRLDPVLTQAGVALPRDLLGRVVALGHANPLTTLTSYHHVAWLLRSHSDAFLTATYANRQTLAPLLGVSLHTLDWAVKKRPGRDRLLAWLDVGIDVREVPAAPVGASGSQASAGMETATAGRGRWMARDLGEMLDDVARVGSLEKVLVVRGAAVEGADALRLLFRPMEARLGRKLIEERGRARTPGHPRRVVRPVGKGRELEVLWEWYDGDDNGRRDRIAAVAAALYEYLQPAQGDRICLPPLHAKELRELMSEAGISPDRIVREPVQGGVEVMRILRPAPAPAAGAEAKPPNELAPSTADRYVGLVLKRILLLTLAASRSV